MYSELDYPQYVDERYTDVAYQGGIEIDADEMDYVDIQKIYQNV